MALVVKASKQRTYKPTKWELAAMRRGEAEFARGEFLTLAEFLHEMRLNRRKALRKKAKQG
jgi:predicted transcriptional regulator